MRVSNSLLKRVERWSVGNIQKDCKVVIGVDVDVDMDVDASPRVSTTPFLMSAFSDSRRSVQQLTESPLKHSG
jgi:hypothetical protein